MQRRASPRRISIVGATGSGKTVLARRLSEEWHLPLYELDQIFWTKEGDERPREDFIRAVSELTQRDAWVLDGHYRAVRELIWHRAETVIWLNYPWWLVAFRLLYRFAAKRRAEAQSAATAVHAGERRNERRAQSSASWRDRLSRLQRTLRERKEYGQLLKAPEYRGVELIELKSVGAAEDLIRARFRSPSHGEGEAKDLPRRSP